MAYANKEDQKAYARQHYLDNKDRYKEQKKRYIKELREFARSFKEVPCKMCGQEFPHYVMDFHHKDPKQKDMTIGRLAAYGNKKRVLEEIKKCDVLCANCHRITHHGV